MQTGGYYTNAIDIGGASGVFSTSGSANIVAGDNTHGKRNNMIHFRNGYVTPTGATIAPRAFGALLCAYLGQPDMA